MNATAINVKDFLTSEDAAKIIGVGIANIGSLCRRGKLPGAIRLGSGNRVIWLIPAGEIRDYARRRERKILPKGGRPAHKS